jgi:hypothetical protein
MYFVLQRLENGEFLRVAVRDEPAPAVQLLETLNTLWPGEYVVRDSEGNDTFILGSSEKSRPASSQFQ